MPKDRLRSDIAEPDVFDILSAVWVLSCNDENPLMTFEGVRQRLGLSENYDLKALISRRGDLFRRGAPNIRVERWKAQMLNGRRIPSWIRELEDENSIRSAIESLTVTDVFRSQFRTRANAPQSEIEIIDWGLQHIDRLRKASLEASEQTAKSWQMWLVFGVGIINVIVVIAVAVLN